MNNVCGGPHDMRFLRRMFVAIRRIIERYATYHDFHLEIHTKELRYTSSFMTITEEVINLIKDIFYFSLL